MLVLAAASVKADDLRLDEMQDELLGGEYYPNNSNSIWYIKFSARVEGEEIVSVCEIWTAQQGYLAEVTALKIPYRNKYSLGVDHMHTRVIRAAKATAAVLKLSWLLPATVDDIAEAYWNMANSLTEKTTNMGKNQVRFAVMYHSIIVRAALRIMNGARKTKDICRVFPEYEYTESSSLFICVQDLPHIKRSLSPHHAAHQQRYIRSDPGDGDEYSGSGIPATMTSFNLLTPTLPIFNLELPTDKVTPPIILLPKPLQILLETFRIRKFQLCFKGSELHLCEIEVEIRIKF